MIRAGEYGKMAALHGTKIETVLLEDVAKSTKTVDPDLYEIAEVFFG
jgi:6-phosphofructokinase 1